MARSRLFTFSKFGPKFDLPLWKDSRQVANQVEFFFSSMPMMTASFSVLLFSIYTQVVTRIYIFHLQVYLRHVTTDAKKSFTFLGCHSKKSRRVIQCDLENSFAKKFEKFAKQLSFRNECKFPRPRTCFKPIIFQFLPVKTLLL